jgi:hypothetical protein
LKKTARARLVDCSHCGEQYDPTDPQAEAQHAHDLNETDEPVG